MTDRMMHKPVPISVVKWQCQCGVPIKDHPSWWRRLAYWIGVGHE